LSSYKTELYLQNVCVFIVSAKATEEALWAEQYIWYWTQRRIGDFAYGRTSKASSMQYSGNLAFSFQTVVHQLLTVLGQTDAYKDKQIGSSALLRWKTYKVLPSTVTT